MPPSAHHSAIELLWRPWLLPDVAIRAAEERASRLGAAGIGAIAGIIAGQKVVQNNVAFWSRSECLFGMAVTGLCCAVFAGAIATFFIRAWMMMDADDLTTELQRAKRRAALLMPICTLLPLAAWSLCAFAVSRLSRHRPLDSDLLALLGSFWMPLILAIPALLLVVWAQQEVARRRASDNHCHACGYSLLGLTEPRCPECGQPFERAKLTRLSPADSLHS